MADLTFREYQRESQRTAGAHDDFNMKLAIWGLGIAGEAGEVADLIKKVVGHGHPLDEQTIRKLEREIGDTLWYAAAIASLLNVSLEAIARENILKLRERYPAGFDPEKSKNRAGE